MRKNLLISISAASLALMAGTANHALSQTYSNAVIALNPAGYWPLQESGGPSTAGSYVATNLGSLGAAGQGYYQTWWQTNGVSNTLTNMNSIVHIAGAITGDSDTALSQGQIGQYVVIPRTTNGVPNAGVTLTAPFSIEAWIYPTNASANTLKPIIAEGFNTVQATNAGYVNTTEGTALGMYSGFLYFVTFNGPNSGTKTEIDAPTSSGSLALNQWYHIVATFNGTTMSLYTNGVLVRSATPPANTFGQNYTPDPVSPLVIGGGNEPGGDGGASALFGGGIDEVAIYNSALSAAQISSHWAAGTNSLRSTPYSQTITNDHPAIYLRLDEPAYTGPSAVTAPVASNYGSLGAAANGYYLSGATPGAAGPSYAGFGASSAVALNGFNSVVDIGGGSLPAALNPNNNQPLTLTAWFKGNPADCVARFQTLIGHSASSWRLNLDNNAGLQFNPGNGPQLQFTGLSDELNFGTYVNDGNWHFLAGVSDGTNDSLYIDGRLAKSGTGVTSVTNGSPQDVILGGDPQFLVPLPISSGGPNRDFDGSLAQVAFFTNALTVSQIQGIYAAAEVPPYIVSQPASQALDAGTVGTVSAVVGGSSPSYQWYHQSGAAVAGQTTATLTFSPVTTGSAGGYYLVATNNYGAVTSAVAQVTVFQSGTYAYSVQQLNPVAYWPLNETNQPPAGQYIATNIGSLGAAGQGYYQSYYQPLTIGATNTFYATNVILHTPGASSPTGDGDPGMVCGYATGAGQYVVIPRTTNGVANAAVTITAPFTVEAWVYTTNLTASVRPIVNQGRNSAQGNASHSYTNSYYGFSLGQYQNYFYWQQYNGNTAGNSGPPEIDIKGIVANQWYYIVATFDGTTESVYTNGAPVGTASFPSYAPDPASPLLIGTGTEPSASNGSDEFSGGIHDVAIYNTALTQQQIQNHYAAVGANYQSTVLGDSPAIFLRLDEPAFNSYPSPSTYPVATNYGSLGTTANGYYQPGTTPGVAGPSFAGFGSAGAVAINGFFGGVDIGGGLTPAQLNPTGTQPQTVTAWFRANPADARFQEIVSRGDSSWRMALNGYNGTPTSTSPYDLHFNPGNNNPDVGFTNLNDVLANGFMVNDGNWHFGAGVSDGTNAYLYIDGALAKQTNVVSSLAGTTLDALIGGSPAHTTPNYNTAGTIRYFDGQIAQVAYFTNALSAAQIQQLYGAADVPPSIAMEPVAATNGNQGQVVTVPTVVRGSIPLTYRWYSTNGTAIAGQTNANLVFNLATTNNTGSYYLVVTNSAGSATSSVVQVTIYGPPTVVAQTATDVRVFRGTAPVLQVSLIGAPPFSYQWKMNGVNLSSATNSSYLPSTATLGSNTYSCLLSNFVGTNFITPIGVTVLADPTAPFPQTVLADHPVDYWRLDESDAGGGNNGLPAYDYAGGNNATYTNVLLGVPGYSSNDDPTETAAQFGVYSGPDANIDDNYAGNVSPVCTFATPAGQNAELSVEAWINSGQVQSSDAGIVCIGYGFGGEQFCLDTGNDTGVNHALRFYINDATGNNHGASSKFVPSDGLWHHVVGVCDEANGQILLYVDGQPLVTNTATANSGLKALTAPLSIGSRLGTSSATTYNNQFAGYIDDVAIYNYALSPSQVLNHYLGAGIAPIITGFTPSSDTNSAIWSTNQGANVTFTVFAEGTAPLSYQWTDNTGSVIAGAITSTLTLTNVQQSQQGNYGVTVTNLYGNNASTNVSFTVLTGPPEITLDLTPTNQTAYVGTPLSFDVQASGTLPLYYQWYLNGSKIPGATNSIYNFDALLGTNSYFVVASNIQPPVAYSSTGLVVGVSRPVLRPMDYTYSMKITFAGYNRSETLQDFPALVQLGTNLPGFSFSQFASASGGDLRFTDASGSNQIPHEIDEWNDNGISSMWVQVPYLNSNTVIYAYWGNPGNTVPEAWSTNGTVWVPPGFQGLPNYQIVYHLNEGAFPFLDSTLNATSTNGVAPAAVPGIVGLGANFTGGSWLDAGTNDVGNVFTLSAWVNYTQDGTIETIWANQIGGFGESGFALWINDYGEGDGYLALASGDKPAGTSGNQTGGTEGASPSAEDYVSPGTWHLIEVPIDRTNGTSSFYVDGVDILDSTKIITDFGTNQDLRLGIFDDNNFSMRGVMDEARIRMTSSDANWIWADYMTVAQNSTFETYGAVGNSSVTLNYQVINGKLVLTWPEGTLQSATQVYGAYTTVSGATSPYTNSISSGQKYFRVLVGSR